MSVVADRAKPGDVEAILRLQEKNLLANVPAERRSAGFVTTAFVPSQLELLIGRGHAFVARDASIADGLAGYVLAGAWDFYFQWPIFEYMASRFPGLSLDGEPLDVGSSYQYGPVCVAEEARGKGALAALFEFHRRCMAAEFPMGITFINEANLRSMDAHRRKLGILKLDEFEFGGQRFATLAFRTRD